MSAMRVVEWAAEPWDRFVDASPHGMVYAKSFFLAAHGLPVRYWRAIKGDETVAGFAAAETARGIEPLNYQNYSTVVVAPLDDCRAAKRAGLVFDALTALAEFLFARYETVALYNHWDVVDMRPFQWVNYRAADKGAFQVHVRYTALLDIDRPDDRGEYQTLRRRCLAKAETAGVRTEAGGDVAILDRLQDETYARQGLERTARQIEMLPIFARALRERGAGDIYVASLDGKPLAAALFAFDVRRAYFMAGGGSGERREVNAGTKLMADAFADLRQRHGLREVDLVGANSPKRGAFKLSFGARLTPFFAAIKSAPGAATSEPPAPSAVL